MNLETRMRTAVNERQREASESMAALTLKRGIAKAGREVGRQRVSRRQAAFIALNGGKVSMYLAALECMVYAAIKERNAKNGGAA